MTRINRNYRLLAVLLVLFTILPSGHATAAADLSVSVQPGLDGKTKMGEGTQIVFTIENKGTSFSGDLVFDTSSGQSSGVGRAVPVTVGEGETKTVVMIVDSLEDGMYSGPQPMKNVHLYEGGWKSGREVSHRGTQQVSAASFPAETLFIAGLGDSIDRFSTLKDLQLKGSQGMEMLNLSKADGPPLPDSAAGWEAADIIAADRYPIADLPDVKQQAMLDWVKSGGTLLISGSDNAAAEAGVFKEDLPLTLGAAVQLPPALFGEKFKEPIPGYEAAAIADAVVLHEKDGKVLAAAKPLGSGMVIQTSFSFGSDVFRSSIGTKPFWTALLDKRSLIVPIGPVPTYYTGPADDLAWTVGDPNEIFPSFKVSTPLLFGFILLYMVLLIPLLYVILKKKDKREHAWWIIPAGAVLVSAAIFTIGAKDRIGKSQLQHSAVYEVQADSSLKGYYAESLLSDKSGDFAFTIQKPSTILINSSSAGVFGGALPAHERAVVKKGAAEENLTFRKLGFWDVATFYGKTEVPAAGRFEAGLKIADGELTGTITNTFPFPMDEVMILSGSKKIRLGPIGAGDTLDVQKEVKTSVLGPRASGMSGGMVQTAANQEDLLAMREEALLEFSSLHLNDSTDPVIAGIAKTQIMEVALKDRKADVSPVSVVLQPVEVETVLAGTVKADSDLMTMELVSESGQSAELLDTTTKEYVFYETEYKQSWQLPPDFFRDVDSWSSLQLLGADTSRYTVELLNAVSGEYETIEGKSTLTAEPGDPYVSEDGKVTVKLTIGDVYMGEPIHPPELRLTGEAAK